MNKDHLAAPGGQVVPSFTPGPWTMQTVRTSSGVCFKVGPFPWKRGQLNHACIYADYPGTGPEYDALVANARLIAAAPAMYAACRQASFALRELLPNDADAQMTVQMLEAALAAALPSPTKEPA